MPDAVIDYLPLQAAARGRAVFITENGRDRSYGEVYEQVKRLAWCLDQECEFGDRVALYLTDPFRQVLAHLACQVLGLISVQLKTGPEKTVAQNACRDTSAKLLLIDDDPGFEAPNHTRLFPFPELDQLQQTCWKERRNPRSTILFTSGTTGTPKGVVLTQRSMMAIVEHTLDFAPITSEDRELVTYKMAYTGGLNPLHVHLVAGGSLLLSSKADNADYLLAIMAKERVTGFYSCPFVIIDMLDQYPEAFARSFGQLKYLLTNCTPVRPVFVEALLKALPDTQVTMYYGMTEASRSVYNQYNQFPSKYDRAGIASKTVSLKVHEPDADGMGEICIRGENQMEGYWNAPEATAKCIDQEGWVHTGDLGFLDKDGFLKVLGRIGDQINSAGYKCQPLEIETVLLDHPEVRDVAVAGVPHPDKHEEVAAMIVLREKPEDHIAVEASLRVHSQKYLEGMKAPEHYLFVAALPKNKMGKIQRKSVKAQLTEAIKVQAE